MITHEFQRDFFEKTDIIRLILWATAIPLPCFFINVAILQDIFSSKKELHAVLAGLFALTYSAVTLPLAVVICHQFELKFSDFVWLVGGSHLIAIVLVLFARIGATRNAKR